MIHDDETDLHRCDGLLEDASTAERAKKAWRGTMDFLVSTFDQSGATTRVLPAANGRTTPDQRGPYGYAQ
jgi:hypothetical protein